MRGAPEYIQHAVSGVQTLSLFVVSFTLSKISLLSLSRGRGWTPSFPLNAPGSVK